MVARARRALRLSAIDHSLRYARAARDRAEAVAGAEAVCREIPLPGLPGAACQIAVPLVTRSRLIGVLVVESTDPLAFMPREDSILTIVAAQLATGIEQLSREMDEASPPVLAPPKSVQRNGPAAAHEELLLLSCRRLRVRRRRISHS